RRTHPMSVGPDPKGPSGEDLLRLGTGIVAAYVSRNSVAAEAVPEIIRTVHQALESLSRDPAPTVDERPKPAAGLYRLPRRREKAQDAQALPALALRHEPRRLPQALGPAPRLPDGR